MLFYMQIRCISKNCSLLYGFCACVDQAFADIVAITISYQLERFETIMRDFNLTQMMIDMYGDAEDSDVCRSYEQFPFYPLQVSDACVQTMLQ